MIAEQTFDVDLITRCVLSNWEWLHDDWETEPEFWFPPIGGNITWVRVGDYGVFLLERRNFIEYSVHTALLKHSRGRAVEIGTAALDWAFKNTPALRLTTTVPSCNPLALRLALKVGFKKFGINEKSFQKNGIIYDQTLLGVSKNENLLDV
jgi:RimJ/RimL family protein N-acetyltransferase